MRPLDDWWLLRYSVGITIGVQFCLSFELKSPNLVQKVKGEVVGQVCWRLKIFVAWVLAGAFFKKYPFRAKGRFLLTKVKSQMCLFRLSVPNICKNPILPLGKKSNNNVHDYCLRTDEKGNFCF